MISKVAKWLDQVTANFCKSCAHKQSRIFTLFDAIKHGDQEHRDWLKKAISNHLASLPVPPPRGHGKAHSQVADLMAVLGKILAIEKELNDHYEKAAGLAEGEYPIGGCHARNNAYFNADSVLNRIKMELEE